VGSAFSTVIDSLFLTNNIQTNYSVCSLDFLIQYLPCNYGALLTLLIACVRYGLALKSAKNIHPPNRKVLQISIGIFSCHAILTVVYFVYNAILDLPITYTVDICAYPSQEPRKFSTLNMVVLQLPNFYNSLSCIIDFQMLRFIKRNIMPGKILHFPC
jgi:hypothetical protein